MSAYTELNSEADYRRAIDQVIASARRELLIFDDDLSRMVLEDRQRLTLLTNFLRPSGGQAVCTLRMVLHHPEQLPMNMPRLWRWLSITSPAASLRQSPDDLRHLADCHVIADGIHAVRRFHRDHARSALVLDDSAYVQPWQRRFDELWLLSQPCLSPTATGL